MTILFMSRLFYPHIGGVEKHVMELSKKLTAKGHKITIITENIKSTKTDSPLDKGESGGISSINGIKIIRITVGNNSWLKKFKIWIQLWKLRKLMTTSDIIHCHDVFFWYLPFRFLFPFKKVYTTFHGYESYPIKKKAIIIRKISEKLSYGNICIGDFMKKWYGAKPDYVSYGAVDTNIIQQNKDPKHSIKESAFFFGRLDEQTGILTYIKIFEKLLKKYPRFKFLVMGEGKYKNQINKKISIIDFQNNPEKYYQKYHFAFISRYLSILEAIASKHLVFAVYDNPVKEDYLKLSPVAKYIVIEKDADLLSEKIIFYLNHPEQEIKLVNDAYNWVKKYTWETMAELYLSLWSKSEKEILNTN